ncbi:hypothetical protein RFI_22137 [Reticulomyxa filosa]|uniref:Kelch motif family protein n=1 Tax=Reticulomyxa filosa TaxID=46433 RepID=X6MP59_RETFI|nr:hypothetical protein RFI_22137 [Reticulomyxa filosa]|eukprot:ETO15227.1 hypothetical protein RFI_22137 [Reticulomyxa filosa]
MYFMYSLCFETVNELKNEQIYQMIIFSFDKIIFITYNEKDNTIIYNHVPVRQSIIEFHDYTYIHLNNYILFFGGYNLNHLRLVHIYSIQQNIFNIFEETLPTALSDGVAVLSEDNDIHIIGGIDQEHNELVSHIKTKLRLWDTSQLLENETKCILQYWIRTLQIRFIWVSELNKIIITYGINTTLLSSDNIAYASLNETSFYFTFTVQRIFLTINKKHNNLNLFVRFEFFPSIPVYLMDILRGKKNSH